MLLRLLLALVSPPLMMVESIPAGFCGPANGNANVEDLKIIVQNCERTIKAGNLKDAGPYWFYATHMTKIVDLGHGGKKFNLQRVLKAWEKASKIDSHIGDIFHNLGSMYFRLGRTVEAVQALETAASKQPATDSKSHHGLCTAYSALGLVDKALQAYIEALSRGLRPSLRNTLEIATMLPVSYNSIGDFKYWRYRVRANLIYLWRNGLKLSGSPSEEEMLYRNSPGYYQLAYFGYNDASTVNLLSRIIVRAAPWLRFVSPELKQKGTNGGWSKRKPSRKAPKDIINVGFISKFLKHHASGKMISGIIPYLNRERFKVVIIATRDPSSGKADDIITRKLHARADQFEDVPLLSLGSVQQRIVSLKLDVLVFCELGMEPYNWMLAHSRLAPVQVATHGHAYTSGIEDSLDFYVTYKLFEGSEAQRYYSEPLVTMHGLVKYPKPDAPPAGTTRQELGLPDTGNIYLCVQTGYKMTPNFDQVWKAILVQDPNGHLVFKQQNKENMDILMGRFRRSMANEIGRIHYVGQVPDNQWFDLFRLSSVMVDSYPFGGYTTSLEALYVGLPIVTLPHAMLGGNSTGGFLQALGLPELIVRSTEAYAKKAVEVATNKEYRAKLSAQILERTSVLFDDETAVRDWEQFLTEAANGQKITNRHGTDQEMMQYGRWSEDTVDSEFPNGALDQFPQVDWDTKKLRGYMPQPEERELFVEPSDLPYMKLAEPPAAEEVQSNKSETKLVEPGTSHASDMYDNRDPVDPEAARANCPAASFESISACNNCCPQQVLDLIKAQQAQLEQLQKRVEALEGAAR